MRIDWHSSAIGILNKWGFTIDEEILFEDCFVWAVNLCHFWRINFVVKIKALNIGAEVEHSSLVGLDVDLALASGELAVVHREGGDSKKKENEGESYHSIQ